LGVSIDLVLAS